ncbi:MAG: alpha/beta hydrolase [Hyphomicrobiaceae bacterium]
MEHTDQPLWLDVDDGFGQRRLAYRVRHGELPGIVWMQGLKSDMVSTKASALDDWAAGCGAQLLHFDYSGHGETGGRFTDATISQWLADCAAAFVRLTSGPQVVVGSSMGGYLAMLLQKFLAASDPDAAKRIAALVLIAPAWDMTEALMWEKFPPEARAAIERDGIWHRPSAYGEPYPLTRALIEDGRNHLFAGTFWEPPIPVTIIHGRLDPDVPFSHSERLVATSRGSPIELIEVMDGEHRLSRPKDLDLILSAVARARTTVATSQPRS